MEAECQVCGQPATHEYYWGQELRAAYCELHDQEASDRHRQVWAAALQAELAECQA